MNVAIFASAFHPHFGGVEELCRQFALELQRQGHRPIVLTNRWPRSLPWHEEVDGIPVYRLPFRAPDAGAKSRLTYALTYHLVVGQMVGILRRHAVEVLHVQCVSSNAHYALAARRRLALPLVVTLQGELTMDATGLFKRSAFARQSLQRCADEAEAVTACSATTLADAEAFLGRPIPQGRVIFNAANVEEFAAAAPYRHERPYVFAIGRMVPQKGFDVLLRAFAESGVTSHDLLLAGDGPERTGLEAWAAELRLGVRVRFLGQADRTRVPSLFAGCSFFVLPSRADEGLPVVCTEAMAAGKAVLASRVGGVPEVVEDGVTGLLVPPADPAALAAAMSRLADQPDLRAAYAAAGLARTARFSWPAITRQYLERYAAALGPSVPADAHNTRIGANQARAGAGE